MESGKKDDYDVVIIGAGIGGLVCGCYLAKAGLKTLIVEKNQKVGGYCTSFTRKGFQFDACAHSFGSYKEGGIISNILEELDIYNRLEIKRYNPSDIIIAPDCKVSFWNDLNETIEEFQKLFPHENKNIASLFKYLNNSKGASLAQLRNKTLKDLLDSYLHDYRLKAILSLPVFGNLGLPASKVSAFTASKYYNQFIFDGGYYPNGGMQKFSDILAERFKELGGSLLSSCLVERVKINNNTVEGVILSTKDFLSAKCVISDCDARQTFFTMIGKNIIEEEMISKLNTLQPSLSIFLLYLGIDKDSEILPPDSVNVWFLPDYDIDNMYYSAMNGKIDDLNCFMIRVSQDKRSILMLVNVPFKEELYWEKNKKPLLEVFSKKAEQIIPRLSNHIIFKDAATPATLYRHTLNYCGAAYGWASLPSQFAEPGLSQTTYIKNLYLTGHWTTLAQGISGVSYLGRDTAELVCSKIKNKL